MDRRCRRQAGVTRFSPHQSENGLGLSANNPRLLPINNSLGEWTFYDRKRTEWTCYGRTHAVAQTLKPIPAGAFRTFYGRKRDML